jgi:aromatic ring-cleaving dioxygenase
MYQIKYFLPNEDFRQVNKWLQENSEGIEVINHNYTRTGIVTILYKVKEVQN